MSRRRRWWRLGLILIVALVVAACSGAPPPNSPPGAGGRGRGFVGVPPTPTTRPATPTPVRPAGTMPARPTASAVASSPYTVVRTFTDAQGRTVTLYHGRGLGTRGDWGWAHIIGKHLYGEWRDGGPLTTFDVVGVTTEAGVQDLIGRALAEDRRPDDSARGRREYRLPVANSRYELLTVVGSDGAIITAYPDPVGRAGG
ncbi:MAG: hypothetical protein IT340_13670 [Chloroflexi bacterium]|nr:hypothetical protein [Chloroflexota bacterium]